VAHADDRRGGHRLALQSLRQLVRRGFQPIRKPPTAAATMDQKTEMVGSQGMVMTPA
jgi:hypothetical protein